MQCVGHRHTQCAQRGVARGDGQDDNAEQSDDAADTAEDILADYTDGFGCERCVSRLKAEVINAHCACRPDHCDEAFEDHHVVEGIASLTLALHGAGDDSRLGGMEAGEYAAGDGYEEYREEVAVCEILAVVEHAVIFPDVVPHLNEGIALDKQTDENADSREQQNAAEDRVNAADDLVDGEYGRDEVVSKDNAVDDPCRGCVGSAREVKDLGCGNVAGGVDKHCADKQQEQAYENVVNREYALIGVPFDHVGHLSAAVAQADHAGEIVMHCAADDVADGDGYECDGSEQDALYRSENGAGTGNVQKVDKAVFPALHGNVVNSVIFRVSRSFTVVRSENLFTELAVKRSASEKHHETDYECYHNVSLLITGEFRRTAPKTVAP